MCAYFFPFIVLHKIVIFLSLPHVLSNPDQSEQMADHAEFWSSESFHFSLKGNGLIAPSPVFAQDEKLP